MGLIENIKSFSEKESLGVEKEKSLQSFLEHGFPTIKDEEWKYTSLKKIVGNNFLVEENSAEISEEEVEKHTLGFEYKIVMIDGNLAVSVPLLSP